MLLSNFLKLAAVLIEDDPELTLQGVHMRLVTADAGGFPTDNLEADRIHTDKRDLVEEALCAFEEILEDSKEN